MVWGNVQLANIERRSHDTDSVCSPNSEYSLLDLFSAVFSELKQFIAPYEY